MRNMNTNNNAKLALQKGRDFYKEIESEAMALGIHEQLHDVYILLGYEQPRQFSSIFHAMAGGWSPKTTDYADLLVIKNHIFAVMKALVILKLDLQRRIKEGNGEQINRLVKSGEISNILLEGLLNKYTGKWFMENKIPKGWVSLRKYGRNFLKVKRILYFIKTEEVVAVPSPIEPLIKEILEN